MNYPFVIQVHEHVGCTATGIKSKVHSEWGKDWYDRTPTV